MANNKKKKKNKKNVTMLQILIKRSSIIAIVLLGMIFAIIRLADAMHPLYGDYQVGNLICASELNVDAEETAKTAATLTMSKKIFSYERGEEWVRHDKPEYRKEKVTDELREQLKAATYLTGEEKELFNAKAIYYVYTQDGIRTNFMLVDAKEGLFLAEYHLLQEEMLFWEVYELAEK